MQPLRSSRIESIDILRGMIMVIMALDHVRDYFSYTPYGPLDLSLTSPLLFFTRWITHLCAPNFVFLSGVSVFLYQQKVKAKKQVSTFLLTRGLWLIVVELVVVSYLIAWDRSFLVFEVIWAIGCSMIVLAALLWLPRTVLMVIAVAMIMFHPFLPGPEKIDFSNLVSGMLHHPTAFVVPGHPSLLVAYTIIPWCGIMLLGYSIGHWFLKPGPEQRKTLLTAGLAALALFVLLRTINVFGDPNPWQVQDRGPVFTMLSFLNVTKNPPSFLFVLVMVGIGLVALALLARARDLSFFRVFGSVPFFYFILHLAVISLAAHAWTYFAFGEPVNLSFVDKEQWPTEYTPNLFRAYGVWVALVLTLYVPCRWFSRYRKAHPERRWLSYL
jgi:uncharacterized membrane protein